MKRINLLTIQPTFDILSIMLNRKCEVCAKDFLVFPYRKGARFCGMKCVAKGRNYKGENNPCFRGGRRIRKDGYIDILTENHPQSRDNYVLEHRLIMEKKIGRYLEPYELVHHINGIKDDNKIENLQLVSHQEHAQIHQWGVINKGRKLSTNHKAKIGMANHLIWKNKQNA